MEARDRQQLRSRNRRLAWLIAGLALAGFAGIILRHWPHG